LSYTGPTILLQILLSKMFIIFLTFLLVSRFLMHMLKFCLLLFSLASYIAQINFLLKCLDTPVPLCNQETKTLVHRYYSFTAKYMRSFHKWAPYTPRLNGASKTVIHLSCIHLVPNYNLQTSLSGEFLTSSRQIPGNRVTITIVFT